MNKKITIYSSLFVLIALVFGLFSYPYYGHLQTELPIKVKPPTPQLDLPEFAADQLIVKFKTNAAPAAIEALKADHGASIARKSRAASFVTLKLPDGSDVRAKAAVFEKNPLVEYAHPNFFFQADFVPNDTFYNLQWHFDDATTTVPLHGVNGGGVGMEPAWDISSGSSSVIVAVLDTGVAYENYNDPNNAKCYTRTGLKKCSGPAINTYFKAPDLATSTFMILPDSDFVNNDDHPNDDESHGTHVTGTVAQSTNNSLGVAGMAFDTTIMPLKVLDANGTGLLGEIADAIEYATDEGADVINLSLGSEFDAQAMEDAVAYAFNDGVTVVTSAGNDFLDGNDIQYPSAYDAYVIAVAATDYREAHAPYSSTGSYVDVAAPGGNTSKDDNYDGFADGVLQQTFEDNSDTSDFSYWFIQGTSMASPHVAALAALIKAVDSSKTPTQIRSVIESTAEEKGAAGRDDVFGHGLIDANAALASLSTAVSISITSDGTTEFGTLELGATQDTTVSGLNDVQTVTIDVGPADLAIKSTTFADNGNVWSLGASNGSNQVKWEFSTSTPWTTFLAADTLNDLANGLASSATQDFNLRLTLPTASDGSGEYSATITIVATEP